MKLIKQAIKVKKKKSNGESDEVFISRLQLFIKKL